MLKMFMMYIIDNIPSIAFMFAIVMVLGFTIWVANNANNAEEVQKQTAWQKGEDQKASCVKQCKPFAVLQCDKYVVCDGFDGGVVAKKLELDSGG